MTDHETVTPEPTSDDTTPDLSQVQMPVSDLEPQPGMGVPGDYDSESITVLEGLEAVRKRPGMYIGSTGERGLHHLVTEIVDNSVDEAMAGFGDTIDVRIMPDGSIKVSDNARGIPVKEHPTEKIPAVTLILTVLHAGGKFGQGGYKVSGGLHGVGASVVNALSRKFDVEVRRDGYRWTQSFSLGVPDGPLERHEATDETGTTTRFWAAEDIFDTVTYNFDTLATRFREMAFLNKGLRINITDERPDRMDEDGKPFSRVLLLRGRADRLRPLPDRQQGAGAQLGDRARVRAARGRASASRSRCSGTCPTSRRCTPSPTRSTPTRAAPTKRASGPR